MRASHILLALLLISATVPLHAVEHAANENGPEAEALTTLQEAIAANQAGAGSVPGLTISAMTPSTVSPSLTPIPGVDTVFWSLAAGVYASAAGDWVTTQRFRSQGIEEANPLMTGVVDSPAGFAAVKVGTGSLINFMSWRLKKSGSRWWAAPQIAWIVLNAAVTTHNTRVMD